MKNNSNPWLTQPEPTSKNHSGYTNGRLVHRKPEVIKHDPSKYRQKPYHAPTASQMIILGGSISTETRPPADKRNAMRKANI